MADLSAIRVYQFSFLGKESMPPYLCVVTLIALFNLNNV